MSGYYRNQLDNESDKATKRLLVMLGLGLLSIVAIAIGVVYFSYDEDYQLLELQVKEAMIVQADNSEGNWMRVELPELAGADQLWIQVSDEFFQSHRLQTKVGVLMGLYDRYDQKRKDGKILKRYRGRTWAVEEIYNSLAEAQTANPVKQYSVPGKVKEKLQRGKEYVLKLEVNQQEAQVVVAEAQYQVIPVGGEIDVQFESIGEYSRITGVENRLDSTT